MEAKVPDHKFSPPSGQGDVRSRHVAVIANTGWNLVRYRGELISALLERNWQVSAIADFSDEQMDGLRRLGARPIALNIDAAGLNPLRDLTYFVRLSRVLRQLRPDLAHFFTIKPVLYGAVAAKHSGIPGIVASITGGGALLRGGGKAWAARVVWPLLRAALAGRPQVIFQNAADMAWFIAKRTIAATQATCIAGSGVDTTTLAPDPDLPAEHRTRFVMASRMLWSKGVSDFVAAARLVRQDFPQASFVLFGGAKDEYGSKNPDFIERAWLEDLNREGILEWRGWTDPAEVESAMRSAAAVVLPSYYPEGIPRSLIEAASAGAPIITTDTPGCRDAVIDGVSGVLVPPRSPDSLAAAMAGLLRDPARIAAMGLRGRELAVTTFDAQAIVDQTLLVYEQALAGPAAQADAQPRSA
jgi:glycosyltransferase involved in cell wall biosynthesis